MDARGLRWAVASSCLTGALLLGGCADPVDYPVLPDPSPSAPASTSPTPEAEPDPSPTFDARVKPERPAAMAENSEAGALAAGIYILQLYPYVYATGDFHEWNDLSHSECIFCSSAVTAVGAERAAGQVSSGGEVNILDTFVSTLLVETAATSYAVKLDVLQGPSGTVDGQTGAVVSESAGAAYHITMNVRNESGAWRIRAVQIDDPPT